MIITRIELAWNSTIVEAPLTEPSTMEEHNIQCIHTTYMSCSSSAIIMMKSFGPKDSQNECRLGPPPMELLSMARLHRGAGAPRRSLSRWVCFRSVWWHEVNKFAGQLPSYCVVAAVLPTLMLLEQTG
ncbi:unnamed protein product [Nesidiocoris tenuis]|uniref:Uncharacterized protein n=1 Tax=Nesidiocoris tenuis TaxID=355587 RepID=A0A6H5HXM5_9HEMI|nr:unnamed protein product [Nesidiocoris tenuis]